MYHLQESININHYSLVNKISEYNELDNELKDMSANNFKQNIKLSPQRPKLWYFKGEHKFSVIHVKLRMNCSSLSADLYNTNIIDSAKFQCGFEYENALHYFLQCPLYTNLRINWSEHLIDLNFEWNMASLLFGDENLSQANNIAATYKSHDYIKD